MAKYDKSNGTKENRIWLCIQSLMNEHGRGGEWYRHVEFSVKVISDMTEFSQTTVRKYLNAAVESGHLSKYEVDRTAHMYMWEVHRD